jgi:hypothetical protein
MRCVVDTGSLFGLLLLLAVWPSSWALAGAGGPDAFGYTWEDSDEVDGPVFAWEEIASTGTISAASNCDDCTDTDLPIGFSFSFYGVDHTTFGISSNGFVSFDSTFDDGCCSGQALPDPSTPNNLIALWW